MIEPGGEHASIHGFLRATRDGIDRNRSGAAEAGCRHDYMTLEEEWAFLRNLSTSTPADDLRTIKQAFEKAVGKRVDASTIRRLLERHAWRKTMGLCAVPKLEGSSSEAPRAYWPTAG